MLNDRSNAKIADVTVNDCMLHLMAQRPSSCKRCGSAFFNLGLPALFSTAPSASIANHSELWPCNVLIYIKGRDLLCNRFGMSPRLLWLALRWTVWLSRIRTPGLTRISTIPTSSAFLSVTIKRIEQE
jgi:hypothetical protein